MSGGGAGTTKCYLQTTLNLGLFQRDQLVYYYCDFAGSGNIQDEVYEDEFGLAMDWYVDAPLFPLWDGGRLRRCLFSSCPVFAHCLLIDCRFPAVALQRLHP